MEPQPPQPLPLPPTTPPPASRPHSVASVAWATALGSPAAGGVVLALNYWKWGQKSAAAAAVTAGFVVTAVILWIAVIAPSSIPSAAFLVPQVLGGYLVAKALQGPRLEAHRVAGGTNASNWIGAGIGIAFGAVQLAALVGIVVFTGTNPSAVFDAQRSVDMGHGQEVYYSRGATREDAMRLGEALKDAGFFDDTAPATVLIAGEPGGREVSFVVAEGGWDDETIVESCRKLAEYVAPAIGGTPLTVRMLDDRMYERKRLQIE